MYSRATRGIDHLINVLQLVNIHSLLNSLDHKELPLRHDRDVDDLDGELQLRNLHRFLHLCYGAATPALSLSLQTHNTSIQLRAFMVVTLASSVTFTSLASRLDGPSVMPELPRLFHPRADRLPAPPVRELGHSVGACRTTCQHGIVTMAHNFLRMSASRFMNDSTLSYKLLRMAMSSFIFADSFTK